MNTPSKNKKEDHINIPPGAFFKAAAHPDLQEVLPLYAFIPQELLKKGGLDEKGYQQSHWPAINCAANSEHAIGSHVFPDLTKPLQKNQIPQQFLKKIETYSPKALGKSPHLRKPGKAEHTPKNPPLDPLSL